MSWASERPRTEPEALARVLVVDDQKIFRDAVRAVVEATPGLTVVGEADCAEAAIVAIDALVPEFVILDVRMPGVDGPELAATLAARTPTPFLLLVSAQPPPMPLPTLADGGDVPFAGKQDLSPALLLRLWNGRPDGSPAAGAAPRA